MKSQKQEQKRTKLGKVKKLSASREESIKRMVEWMKLKKRREKGNKNQETKKKNRIKINRKDKKIKKRFTKDEQKLINWLTGKKIRDKPRVILERVSKEQFIKVLEHIDTKEKEKKKKKGNNLQNLDPKLFLKWCKVQEGILDEIKRM